jgi:hypothetical protein
VHSLEGIHVALCARNEDTLLLLIAVIAPVATITLIHAAATVVLILLAIKVLTIFFVCIASSLPLM